MKKTIFASRQTNHLQMLQNAKAYLLVKCIGQKSFFQLLYASSVALTMLFAPGRTHAQSLCEDAIPCVSNISDYECIETGSAQALMSSGKLEWYPGPAETIAQKIIVTNSISFNVPYRFYEGSEIILLPGAKLSIGSDFATLGNVTIRGCGDHWSEIKVFSNGTFTFAVEK